MSNSSIKSKTALLRNGETQKGNGYPEANDYSARILETMQTGVVFFNTEQIISGINNLACEDLQIPRDPSGHKITDIISIIHHVSLECPAEPLATKNRGCARCGT